MAIKREGQWCPHTRTHRVDAHDVARLVQLVSSETGLGSLAATAAVAQLPAQLADARCVRIGTTAIVEIERAGSEYVITAGGFPVHEGH